MNLLPVAGNGMQYSARARSEHFNSEAWRCPCPVAERVTSKELSRVLREPKSTLQCPDDRTTGPYLSQINPHYPVY
jgi:hypothetical protein